MTKIQKDKKCKKKLRHSEYYSQMDVYDKLYRLSRDKAGMVFTDLMNKILSRKNILLAYRNIKRNKGSNTPGTDGKTIKDIAKLKPGYVIKHIRDIVNGQSGKTSG